MTTEVKVNSRICDHIHSVRATKDGKKIIVEVDTSCEKIKQMSGLEVSKMELFDMKDSSIMERAKESKVCATCIVPAAVMTACHIETGFISKNLAERAGSVSMEFKSEEEKGSE